MEREQALDLLKSHLKTENLRGHSLAVEAIMRGLADRFGQDCDKFGLAGLLHDIDLDHIEGDMGRHSLVGGEILEENGIDPDVVYAVKAHNDVHGLERVSLLDKCLWAADPVSGFIIAAALIRPDKSLSAVELKSLKKRFKEARFAAGANREQMASCIDLGLELDQFLTIALDSMKPIASELGL